MLKEYKALLEKKAALQKQEKRIDENIEPEVQEFQKKMLSEGFSGKLVDDTVNFYRNRRKQNKLIEIQTFLEVVEKEEAGYDFSKLSRKGLAIYLS